MSTEEEEAPEFARPGEILAGKYKVERVLGRGGMGVVLAAEHTALREHVAIKMLLPEMLGGDRMLIERFFREAQILAKIKSEHVVRVTDMGTLPNGVPFLVMEYLQGRDLGQILNEVGAFQIERAVDYMLQAMEALAEAHSKGIVHRDLKPSNLFLTTRADGSPLIKLLDFGISKMSSAEDDGRLTSTQTLLGSPLYMSPEQLTSAKNAGPRADLWSLGVILYELLTGHLPFHGRSIHEITAKILRDPPTSPCAHRPELPRDLESIILRCLQRNPSTRYSDVAHLASALVPYSSPGQGDEYVKRIHNLLGERKSFADVVHTTGRHAAVSAEQAAQIAAAPSGWAETMVPVSGASPIAAVPPKNAAPAEGMASASPADLALPGMAPPRILGRYALYEAIASGGMASIHIGRLLGQVGFNRTVAVKRLHEQFARDPEFAAMFLDEARIAARIRHPNVVPTIDVVALENELFLVMEFIQGESLSHLLKHARNHDERVPLPIVSKIMGEVLMGLHAAHEARNERGEPLNIVHRDVSPQNVLVGADGVTRVVDFGIAKAVGRMAQTRDGQIKGKVQYMAPEQLSGKDVTRSVDIYAASVILWEAVAGRRLMKAENDVEAMYQIMDTVPERLRSINPRVPLALDELVARGLQKNAVDRFATAREMALALDAAVSPTSSSVVSDWVQRIAGERLSQRSAQIARIESENTPAVPFSLSGAGTFAPVQAPPSSQTPEQPTNPSATVPTLPMRPASRAPLLVGIGLVAIVGAFVGLRKADEPAQLGASATAPAASAATAAPSASAAAPSASPPAAAAASAPLAEPSAPAASSAPAAASASARAPGFPLRPAPALQPTTKKNLIDDVSKSRK